MDSKSIGADEQRETSRRVKAVRRVTWIGLLANVLLSVFKVSAGIIGNSQAVVADGVHSLSDTSTDVAVLIGVRYWSAPPDEAHPHGHHRIETVVTVFIALILAGVAIGLGCNALSTIRDERAGPPDLIALIAALVSIVSKEILYRWTIVVGKRSRSSALIANAWHHRSDGLSSIPVALAVAGTQLFPDWYFLDQIGAVVVSVFILLAAWKIAWPALKELTDTGASAEAYKKIEEISLATAGVRQVHKIRGRRLGYGLQIDLHVQVDGTLSVQKGHEISEAVKRRLLEDGPDIIDVVTHLEPYNDRRPS